MTEWQPLGSAPRDGTWIDGKNKAGEIACIQARRIHPKVDTLAWFVGDPEQQGHWQVSKCFYPTEWRPRESQEEPKS